MSLQRKKTAKDIEKWLVYVSEIDLVSISSISYYFVNNNSPYSSQKVKKVENTWRPICPFQAPGAQGAKKARK